MDEFPYREDAAAETGIMANTMTYTGSKIAIPTVLSSRAESLRSKDAVEGPAVELSGRRINRGFLDSHPADARSK